MMTMRNTRYSTSQRFIERFDLDIVTLKAKANLPPWYRNHLDMLVRAAFLLSGCAALPADLKRSEQPKQNWLVETQIGPRGRGRTASCPPLYPPNREREKTKARREIRRIKCRRIRASLFHRPIRVRTSFRTSGDGHYPTNQRSTAIKVPFRPSAGHTRMS
ncbi:unnamed protein product [Ectocarpus sp. 8 AP-2014]